MITPAYLDRFSCIGENCEDNCCHDWLIHIDKTHYYKIKEAMSVNAEKQSLFKANVQLTLKNKSSNERYAHLVLDHQQQCGFLETNGLCGLQMHYPQNRLPEGCRSYPRKIFLTDSILKYTDLYLVQKLQGYACFQKMLWSPYQRMNPNNSRPGITISSHQIPPYFYQLNLDTTLAWEVFHQLKMLQA